MGNGQAAAADRPNFAVAAATAASPVLAGLIAGIDVVEGLAKDVADQGGEFSAGMHFAVGKDGDKVESSAAAEAGAAAGQRFFLFGQEQVEDRKSVV